MSPLAYRAEGVTESMSMDVDSVQRSDRITSDRILAEATGWGLSRPFAIEVVSDLLARPPAAARRASAEVEGLPARLPVYEELARLLETVPAAAWRAGLDHPLGRGTGGAGTPFGC